MGFEQKRRAYKMRIVNMVKDNPDLTEEQIVAQMSAQTGLRHAKVYSYIEELKAEGRI